MTGPTPQMALMREFKETVQARVDRDPAFRKALLVEGTQCLVNCDVETADAIFAYLRADAAENSNISC